VADDAIRCDACPVLCYIKPGRTGSCDRYGNHEGKLVRLDPHVVLDRALERGDSVVPFLESGRDWDGTLIHQSPASGEMFVTAIGAGTTYPDYKPAPFIISVAGRRRRHGHGGDRRNFQLLRRQGEDRHRPPSRRGVQHGSRAGRSRWPRHHQRIRFADAVARRRPPLDRRQPPRRHASPATRCYICAMASGRTQDRRRRQRSWCRRASRRSSTASQEERMRVGCGSATIGMFAKQWFGKVDEVVVVDDHITGVLSEHQAGKLLGVPRDRNQIEGPALDARTIFSSRRARNIGLGWNRHRRSALDSGKVQPEKGLARPDAC
jgi:6-hydroxynicotinate reductase